MSVWQKIGNNKNTEQNLVGVLVYSLQIYVVQSNIRSIQLMVRLRAKQIQAIIWKYADN